MFALLARTGRLVPVWFRGQTGRPTGEPSQVRIGCLWGSAATVDLAFFPAGIPFNQSGAFELLLGAPIGDANYCHAYTQTERVGTALPLLEL